MSVVGLAIAPIAAVAAPGDEQDVGQQTAEVGPNTTADHGPFPHEICTDLLAMIDEEAPYDQIVWVSDLPEDLQPPGVPWTVITPSAVAGIIVGATPNHCEVQDPNDPSYDPIRNDEDNFDPDAGGDAQPGEDGEVLFIVNGTLDNTSEGPGGVAEADLELTENGTIDPNARLHDGEKEYGVDPGLQYWSDGTTYFETDVYVFNSRVGYENDCFGEECNSDVRGLPGFVDYPAVPSHTDRERPDDGSTDDSDDGAAGGENGSDDGPDSDGSSGDDGSSDGTGASGANDSGTGSQGTSDGTDGDGDDGGDADSSDGSSGDSDDGGDADSGDSDSGDSDADGGDGSAGDGDDGGDGAEDGGDDDTEDTTNQQQPDTNDNQGVQRAAAPDGSGLGVIIALVVFVVGAAAIAPRD